jgi:hypothetical protein
MTPPLMPIKSISNWPFSTVTTDFMTNLPVSEGYNLLMVIADHGLMKGIVLIPCKKDVDALQTADMFIDHVYQ